MQLQTWIVIVGNPADGFAFHGPFTSFEAADKWANAEVTGEWHIAPLNDPGE